MIVDLSHEIAAGMVTYPGIAGPQLEVVMSREATAARLGPITSGFLPGQARS